MSQRDKIVAAISKASSLQEQAALVSQLDAFDRQARMNHQASRAWDGADAVVRETLQPVAVHERDTHETDWLGEVTASSGNDTNAIVAEAAMWYRRVSDEVKADDHEFAEQARGIARRTAGVYGEHAQAAQQQFLEYVSFLRQREGASGLPQVEQLVDSQENPSQTPLPEDTFDNFAPPVHPINEGVVGTETSERAPLIQEVMGEGGSGQGQPENPNHHDTAPQPYSYAEVPPQEPQQMTQRQSRRVQAGGSRWCEDCGAVNDESGMCPSCHPNSQRGEDDYKYDPSDPTHRRASYDVPSVAISHVGNLDEFRAMFAREAEKPSPDYHAVQPSDRRNAEFTDSTEHSTAPYGQHPYPEGEDEGGSEPNPLESPNSNDVGKEGRRREAASTLPQVEQVVDSFENPDPQSLPQDVAFPWELDDDDPQKQHEQRSAAFQRRAAYVAALLQKDPDDLTGREVKEIRSFTANLRKRADQFSQPHQYPGGSPANNPGTTPEGQQGTYPQGYAEGRSDWALGEAPTYADDSSHVTDFVRGHSEGYGDAARSDQYLHQGQQPPGAGNRQYQTHAGSRTASRKQADAGDRQCQQCGKTDSPVLADTGPACRHCGSYSLVRPGGQSGHALGMRVSASFTSPVEANSPEFRKGYAYATKWNPRKPLVTTGSAEFEAGLYAGMSDNPGQQRAWAEAHKRTAKRYHKPEFIRRMSLHHRFSKRVAAAMPDSLRVQGAYVVSRQPRQAKTAATTTDLDTIGPTTSPSPTGETPINGPGRPGPLAGAQDPAAPGGPAPYNAAPPYGQPVVPNRSYGPGQPGYIDATPGAPVDQAAMQRLSPQQRMSSQTLEFRKRVQSNLLASNQNGSQS